MRSIISLCFVVVLALAFVACNTDTSNRSNANLTTANRPGTDVAAPRTPTSSAPAVPSDGAPRITIAELRERMAKNTAVVVDVRGADAYQLSHIKGSINIPEAEVATRSDELPKGRMIVTYCS